MGKWLGLLITAVLAGCNLIYTLSKFAKISR